MLEDLVTELKLRGLRPATVKAYLYHNERFLATVQKQPLLVTQQDIKSYLANYLDKATPATASLVKSALRFYYDEILKLNIVTFKSPKPSKKLPVVLTKEEVLDLIEAAPTKKSRLLVQMLYGSGLRVSECTGLKVVDVELDACIGWVRSGKGAKDRMIILSDTIIKSLRTYLKTHQHTYLFSKEMPLSSRSVQQMIKRLAEKAGIKKDISPHSLRHSFATHLLQQGTDIRVIQELLGHEYLKTTQIYTKVTQEQIRKVRSPLDVIMKKR